MLDPTYSPYQSYLPSVYSNPDLDLYSRRLQTIGGGISTHTQQVVRRMCQDYVSSEQLIASAQRQAASAHGYAIEGALASIYFEGFATRAQLFQQSVQTIVGTGYQGQALTADLLRRALPDRSY